MEYEIEEYCTWEYPSRWAYVEACKSLQEAKDMFDLFRSKNPRIGYRIITVIDEC